MLQAWSQTHVTWNQTPANTKSSPLYSDACKNAHIGILFIFLQSYVELFLLLLFAVCCQVIQQVSFSFAISSCIHCALSLCLFKTFSFPPILIPCSPPSIHLSISDHLTTHPPLVLSCWLCCWGPMKQPSDCSELKHMLSRNYGWACQRGAVGNSVFSSVQLSQP